MNTRRIFRLLAVTFAWPVVFAAHASEVAVPFRPISFEEATQAAAKEGRLVFVDFFTTWCEPCKRLDAETFTQAGVGQLIGEAAVPIKLDAEKEGLAIAKRYKVSSYPTLLLVKADGTEVDRILGFRERGEFSRDFKNLVALARAGKTGLEQARTQVAQQAKPLTAPGDAEEAQPHFDLARKLIVAGKFEEAFNELIWCWDEGKKDPEFSRMRSSMVARELGRVARDYPPAREGMILRRDQARERALANKGGAVVVQDLVALNKELKTEEDTIEVFDQMPEGDRRKVTIAIYTFDLLVEKKRYADAVLFYRSETQLLMLASHKKRMTELGANDEAAASSLRFLLTSNAKRVEALAGAGRLDEARELAQHVLKVDDSDGTKSLLRSHAARAGRPELVKDL